jgi:hypothetical protein
LQNGCSNNLLLVKIKYVGRTGSSGQQNKDRNLVCEVLEVLHGVDQYCAGNKLVLPTYIYYVASASLLRSWC